jgi:hypothetical protein
VLRGESSVLGMLHLPARAPYARIHHRVAITPAIAPSAGDPRTPCYALGVTRLAWFASVTIVAIVASCGDHAGAPPVASGSAPVVAPSCDEQARALHDFLDAVWDHRAVPPWQTGDVALDRWLDARRDELRAAGSADSSQRARSQPSRRERGPLDDELARCPGAPEALARVGSVDTGDEKRAAFVGIAGAIRACDCKPDLARVRALFYLMMIGPD